MKRIDFKSLLTETSRNSDKLEETLFILEQSIGLFVPKFYYRLSKELQEEVKQDFFETYIKYHKDYRAELGSLSWLQTLFKHKVIDLLRKENKSLPEQIHQQMLHSEEDKFLIKEELTEIFELLTPEQSSILLEAKLLGSSIHEISQSLSYTTSKVKTIISRTLKKVRKNK